MMHLASSGPFLIVCAPTIVAVVAVVVIVIILELW